jgi:hypothetical protein
MDDEKDPATIWEGFKTDNAFEQRVADTLRMLPCKTHAKEIKALSRKIWAWGGAIAAIGAIIGAIIGILQIS